MKNGPGQDRDGIPDGRSSTSERTTAKVYVMRRNIKEILTGRTK